METHANAKAIDHRAETAAQEETASARLQAEQVT